MNKKSLAQEVSKLKALLDVAAASTTVSGLSGVKNSSNSNDEDEVDVDDDVDQEPLPIGLEPICVIQ